MPVVEKVRGGRVTVRHVGHFDVGDRKEVSAEEAAYLVEERGDFAYVDESEADGDPAEADDDTTDGSSEEDAAAEADEPDADEADDDAPKEADAEGSAAYLAEQPWRTAVSTVEAGDADDYLDELEAVDDRNSVQDAIAERRAELEG